MAQGWANRLFSRAPQSGGAGLSARLVILAWVLFIGTALLLLVPARYTATTTLSFDVATQPSPAMVRGISQMLASRDMSFEVLDSLSHSDAAWLASPRGLPGWLTGDNKSARDRAAARLGTDVDVVSRHGGRTLEISATAGSADLAARIARAYALTFSKLQTGARRDAPELAEAALPLLSVGTLVQIPTMRDPPSTSLLLALAVAGITLGAATLRVRRRPVESEPDMDADDAREQRLPSQTTPSRRVAWVEAGDGTGLTCADATLRLAAHIRREQGKAGAKLVVVTSDMPAATSATCAIGLARQMAEESRVALVALDGTSSTLSALIPDPRAPGVAEMLFGVAGFGETIHRDPQSRAHVIPPGRDALAGATAIGAERLNLILNALRQTYDFVVVAAPVLGGVASASKLAELDPVVICIEETDGAPADVEGYDALAALGFANVLMLRILSPDAPSAKDKGDAQAPRMAALPAA